MKLDIGCRQSKTNGFIGINTEKFDHVDIVHDLSIFPWPIENDTVEEIFCSYYLERVPDIFTFLNELYRICKKDAKLVFISAYYNNVKAISNPENIRQISEYTFGYFSKSFRIPQNLPIYDFDFTPISVSYKCVDLWNKRSEETKEFARNHYINSVEDIRVELNVVK